MKSPHCPRYRLDGTLFAAPLPIASLVANTDLDNWARSLAKKSRQYIDLYYNFYLDDRY